MSHLHTHTHREREREIERGEGDRDRDREAREERHREKSLHWNNIYSNSLNSLIKIIKETQSVTGFILISIFLPQSLNWSQTQTIINIKNVVNYSEYFHKRNSWLIFLISCLSLDISLNKTSHNYLMNFYFQSLNNKLNSIYSISKYFVTLWIHLLRDIEIKKWPEIERQRLVFPIKFTFLLSDH